MIPAPILENDEERVGSLERMNILDTARESDLDRVVRITQKCFNVEIVLISLVDKDRQWFKARCGLDTPETGRDISFCAHAIEHDEIFLVEDTKNDARFADNPLVIGGPEIAFYAGQPLINSEGHRIGTLCIISSKARGLTDRERLLLEDLGRITETLLANRPVHEEREALLASITLAERRSLVDPLTGLWNLHGYEELFRREIHRAIREKQPILVGIVAIDDFDDIANEFGPDAGERAMGLAAELLIESLRATDIVARRSAGQFLIAASDVDPDRVSKIGDKIINRFRVAAKLTTPQGPRSLTVSIGTLVLQPATYSETLLENSLAEAERTFAKAMAAGGDRFEVSGAPDYLAPAY